MHIEFSHYIDSKEEAISSLRAMLHICKSFDLSNQDIHDAVLLTGGPRTTFDTPTPIVASMIPGSHIPEMKKIQLIKLIRIQTGCGLREAKLASESIPMPPSYYENATRS
jgi:hypothetical protein